MSSDQRARRVSSHAKQLLDVTLAESLRVSCTAREAVAIKALMHSPLVQARMELARAAIAQQAMKEITAVIEVATVQAAAEAIGVAD